jgi:DNA polymerase III subunit delta
MTSARPDATLLWGEDAFLLREAAYEAFGDVRPVEVDGGEWRGGETSDLATPSLFGEQRGLLVTDAKALPDAGVKELAAYLAEPVPGARLVLAATVSERASAPAALAKMMKAAGGEVRQVAVARKDLQAWVLGRVKRHGGDLRPDAAKLLVDTLGESPAALDGAVSQLASAFPGVRVGPEQVAAQFQGLGDQHVWDLCDRLFGRDLAGSVRSLRALLEGRSDPLAILGGVSSRLRELIRVKALPERMPADELSRALGLRFEWQGRRYRDQARRFTMGELLALHHRVVAADRELKSGGQGDIVLASVLASVAEPR